MKKIVAGLIIICMFSMVCIGCTPENNTEAEPAEVPLPEPDSYLDTILSIQDDYIKTNNIPTVVFSERDEIENLFDSIMTGTYQGEHDYVESSWEGLFSGAKVKRTLNEDTYYFGNFNDNTADGYGLLIEPYSGIGQFLIDAYKNGNIDALSGLQQEYLKYGISGIIYLGEFDDGKPTGYGMAFEDLSRDWLERYYGEDIFGEEEVPNPEDGFADVMEFDSYFYNDFSFMCYEGEFENGKESGNGNLIEPNTMDAIYDADSWGIDISKNLNVKIGDFRKGSINGEGRYYLNGTLAYEGEWKKGKMNGKGKMYFYGIKDNAGNPILQYDGEFKDNEYDGKGTLYDENGNVVYSGGWARGNYN